jgi:large subunit ribosomal protein L1
LIKRTNVFFKDAAALIKVVASAKFDESVDIAGTFGCRSKKSESNGKRCVTLPHGTGKDVKVLALVTPDKEAEALLLVLTMWS